MYLRFTGPKESKITIYRGFDAGQTLELPCTVGFRPGYSYRFAVSDVPGFPRRVFYPSLEVRGTLSLIPKLRNADFPAHINFTEDEFAKVVLGTFIKKVVILERPDQAFPIATKPDEPIEIPVSGSRDPVVEGNERGQPLVTLHLGERFLTPQELNALAVPGTVLLPGERILGSPRRPPWLEWRWCPVYDPVYGPKHPSEYTTLYDGGDVGGPAGFGFKGKLKGLDPTDTVAEYMDSKGTKRLAVSNRVGLCVPRFVLFKSETLIATHLARLTIGNTLGTSTPSNVAGQASLKEQSQQQHPEAVGSKLRPSGAFNMTGTSVVGRVHGLDVKATMRTTESVDAIAVRAMKSEAPDGPLFIIKWPDKAGALVGDVVTFFLKYTNTGGQPITDVVVSDSLTTRFEYVKGSTKTDRDAIFTTQTNEAGSAVLRWEFTGTLQPRESGMISFQVRIR